MENRMLEGVTEEERETFFRVIDKIKDNLKIKPSLFRVALKIII